MSDHRQAYPSDLSDAEWQLILPLVLLPQQGPGPRRWVDLREVVNALLYKQDTGCQWRLLPPDLPPRSTVHGYYLRWRRLGIWEQICRMLNRPAVITRTTETGSSTAKLPVPLLADIS